MQKHNFGAGPCILPPVVFEQTSQAVKDLDNSGLSVMEISHRSQAAKDILEETVALTKELMNVPDTHEVIFMQGGASLQFICVPYNLMNATGGKAVYLDTGSWSSKAIKEAKCFGEAVVIASSKDKNYNYIPKDFVIPEGADYFHCTSNNTIFGTQIKEFANPNIPMICDMSSDILSREIDVNDFDLIYAGAQKNMGPAGATVAIIRKSILNNTQRAIPSYLNYQIHIDKGSAFNTWPVVAIYAMLENLRWVKEQGGVPAMAKRAKEKADLLYAEIDRNPLFKGTAEKEDRSQMNATFVLSDDSLAPKFDELWQGEGIVGLKGHRSVGGYRASMYNALPVESVAHLVEVMKRFEDSI